uniref:SNARE Ykt6 n=1 Tax=Pyricularia oryzae (strain P131) TaxID=1143193 RepID=L7JHZ9_PYRO1
MKLHYIGIFRNDSKPAHEIVAEKELSAYSRFTRSNYAEFMTFTSKTVAERTKARICGIIISDHAYPALVAHQLLSKVVDEFLAKHPRSAWATGSPSLPFPELKEYITTYQDPHAADSILKIQKELDETKIVLHKTIESVLQRGEKIDDLVAKSDGLSAQSKMFYNCRTTSISKTTPTPTGRLQDSRHTATTTVPPLMGEKIGKVESQILRCCRLSLARRSGNM